MSGWVGYLNLLWYPKVSERGNIEWMIFYKVIKRHLGSWWCEIGQELREVQKWKKHYREKKELLRNLRGISHGLMPGSKMIAVLCQGLQRPLEFSGALF